MRGLVAAQALNEPRHLESRRRIPPHGVGSPREEHAGQDGKL
jgi:hypothetical protein